MPHFPWAANHLDEPSTHMAMQSKVERGSECLGDQFSDISGCADFDAEQHLSPKGTLHAMTSTDRLVLSCRDDLKVDDDSAPKYSQSIPSDDLDNIKAIANSIAECMTTEVLGKLADINASMTTEVLSKLSSINAKVDALMKSQRALRSEEVPRHADNREHPAPSRGSSRTEEAYLTKTESGDAAPRADAAEIDSPRSTRSRRRSATGLESFTSEGRDRRQRLAELGQLYHSTGTGLSRATGHRLRGAFRNSRRQSSVSSTAEFMHQIQLDATFGKQRSETKYQMWLFLTDPYAHSVAATVYDALFNPLIVGSIVLDQFQQVEFFCGRIGASIALAVESFFMVDILLRFVVSPSRSSFLKNFYNCVDILAVLPWAARIHASLQTEDLICTDRIWHGVLLGLVPVLRLFKLLRRFDKTHLLYVALLDAIEALPALMLMLCVLILLFAAVVYLVEPPDNIVSMPHSTWFVLVTMMTIGYGDVTPVSTLGSAVTSVLIVLSALYLAIPISMVGMSFSNVWGNRKILLALHETRQRLADFDYTAAQVQGPAVERLLSGKTVAADAAVWFYEATCQADVRRIFGEEGAVLKVTFERCVRWLRKGVLPVVVLEGDGGGRAHRTFSRGRGKLGSAFRAQPKVRALLSALGVPWVDAEGEAEATCAALAMAGACDFVATTDFDALLFGAPKVLRGLDLQRDTSKCELWDMETIDRVAGVDRHGLIAAAFLVGCDYDCRSASQLNTQDGHGVRGVGPKQALSVAQALRGGAQCDALAALGDVLFGRTSRESIDSMSPAVGRALHRAAADSTCFDGFTAAVRQYTRAPSCGALQGMPERPFSWRGVDEASAAAVLCTIFNQGRVAEKLDPLLLEWSLRSVAEECPASVRADCAARRQWAKERGLRYVPLSATAAQRRKSSGTPYALVRYALADGDGSPVPLPHEKRHARISLVKACGLLTENKESPSDALVEAVAKIISDCPEATRTCFAKLRAWAREQGLRFAPRNVRRLRDGRVRLLWCDSTSGKQAPKMSLEMSLEEAGRLGGEIAAAAGLSGAGTTQKRLSQVFKRKSGRVRRSLLRKRYSKSRSGASSSSTGDKAPTSPVEELGALPEAVAAGDMGAAPDDEAADVCNTRAPSLASTGDNIPEAPMASLCGSVSALEIGPWSGASDDLSRGMQEISNAVDATHYVGCPTGRQLCSSSAEQHGDDQHVSAEHTPATESGPIVRALFGPGPMASAADSVVAVQGGQRSTDEHTSALQASSFGVPFRRSLRRVESEPEPACRNVERVSSAHSPPRRLLRRVASAADPASSCEPGAACQQTPRQVPRLGENAVEQTPSFKDQTADIRSPPRRRLRRMNSGAEQKWGSDVAQTPPRRRLRRVDSATSEPVGRSDQQGCPFPSTPRRLLRRVDSVGVCDDASPGRQQPTSRPSSGHQRFLHLEPASLGPSRGRSRERVAAKAEHDAPPSRIAGVFGAGASPKSSTVCSGRSGVVDLTLSPTPSRSPSRTTARESVCHTFAGSSTPDTRVLESDKQNREAANLLGEVAGRSEKEVDKPVARERSKGAPDAATTPKRPRRCLTRHISAAKDTPPASRFRDGTMASMCDLMKKIDQVTDADAGKAIGFAQTLQQSTCPAPPSPGGFLRSDLDEEPLASGAVCGAGMHSSAKLPELSHKGRENPAPLSPGGFLLIDTSAACLDAKRPHSCELEERKRPRRDAAAEAAGD